MKTKIGLFLFTMLAWAGMGFAAPGASAETPKSYYNLTTHVVQAGMWGYGMGGYGMGNGSTTLVLSQGSKACSSPDWSLTYNGIKYTSQTMNGKTSVGYYQAMGPMYSSFKEDGECLASVEDTPANLAALLEDNWINGDTTMKKVPLELWSNIDLKEFAANTKVGECEVNHVPLPMMENTEFNGNGFTISHLCYAATVTDTEPMTAPVGFFESAANVSMRNVKLNGVRIYIDGTSTDGKDYYPVGAFVGAVNSILIDNVALANDSIQAPIAGGVVGFVKNSTISNITGDDDIHISNIVSITTGYAGSEEINKSAGTLVGHNVFLGGIAGVAVRTQSAEDATFKNDSVKVDVHDYATGHRSALGGIAGLNQTIGGPANNLYVYTKNKDGGEVIPSKISGGASMGGIFGVSYVPRDNNVTDAGNFVVSNSKFEGKLYDAASPSVMAVGGILGLDSSDAQTSVRVTNSAANIDIKDSLKVAGLYQYFAGGIVGYGSSCVQGGSDGDEFLTVTGAKTTGSIALSAAASVVPGLHSDAFLGGVVGSACIAQTKGLGLTNDTSSVQITSKVKTSVDGNKKVNGANARDSVYVGGIVGFASIMMYNAAATVAHLYYEGSIVVEDSLNNVFVGGILGGFTNDQGGRTLILNDVLAKSTSQLIKYTAKDAGAVTTTNVQVANIGGVCGLCNEISEMSLVAALGDISVVGKHAGDYLYVGGLIGRTQANNVRTVVKNTYNVGDISVTANNASLNSYDKKVGYLIGKAEVNKGYEIKSSYHFGEDDDETVTLPVGFLKTEQETNTWVDSDSISYVLRNSSASQQSARYNGTEIAKTMKSSQFAGTLNEAYADAADYVWTFAKDNNNNLPFFANGQYEPIAPTTVVSHVVVFADLNGDPIVQQTVVHGGAATAPVDSVVTKIEGYTFTGSWDKDFDNIISDLTVTAVYDKNSYTVRFFDFDDTQFGTNQSVLYQESATAPNDPERVGYTFAGWDDSTFVSVTKDLDVYAMYVPNKYWIVFKKHDGEVIMEDSIPFNAAVPQPVDVPREATAKYTYEFIGWTPEVVNVNGDAVYTATYDSTKVLYAVTFVDYDDTPIGDTVWVEYDSAAAAPADPTREGYAFVGWDRKFDVITKNIEVKAVYEQLKFWIVFKDFDGEELKADSLVYGATVVTPKDVKRASTAAYKYTFKSWSPDVAVVTADAEYTAEYDSAKVLYAVTFVDYDETPIGDTVWVEYDSAAVAPADPTREGYKFVGWDRKFDVITKNIEVMARYERQKYWIVFRDYNGDQVKADSVLFEGSVNAPKNLTRSSTAEYSYLFKGWDPVVTAASEDKIYTAVYDSLMNIYSVTFLDYDGSRIGDVQKVEYGSAAVAPAEPKREGFAFFGWDSRFDSIVENTEVKALYEKLPESSSSAESSSSVESSSSHEPESSSSILPESSSSVESSSSIMPEFSSSVESSRSMGEIKIVKPTIEQSGNAVLLTFGTENADESSTARVVVTGEHGVILDTVIAKSIVGGGQWQMTPAPIGKFSVTLTVGDQVNFAEYEGAFEVASEIAAQPGSWQMVSLSAFDKKKVGADATFYWWDERNPVGDYWQYRAFDGGVADATRGFWYGTTDGNPLVIRESTGARDSEIVWELDSLYSGWNLVANPYGWYVDLSKGKADSDAKVSFWRWNPATAEYEVPTMIGPYEAVWVKVSHATTWKMPAAPSFKFEKKPLDESKKALHKDVAGIKGAWNLKVSLTDEYGKRDSWNVIGAGAEESLEEPPAGMGNHVTLAIRNSEKGAKLAKSIKAVADEYSWILDVSASSMRDGSISFEGIKELNGQGFKVFVTADGKTTEVTDGKSVNVALAKSASQVEVRVAASNAVVASSKISGFASTLAGGTLQLGFTAPEALAGARASYAVVGVDGKKVAAGQFKATAGTNQFSLNAPKSGVYFVKIKVGSQLLSGKVLVK